MMCRRANEREAFGGKLAEKQFVQDFIAKSRMETDQARLLTLYAAWKMDTEGKRAARQEISMIKVVAANVVMDVLDRAIQVHGALGMSDDTPLAGMWRFTPHAQGRRRPRRGPQDGDRPPRAEPLGEAGRGASGDATGAEPARVMLRAQAPLGLVGGLGELLDDAGELLEALVALAVLALGVAGEDALEDDRQLPVAQRDVEVDLGEVAAERSA